MVEIQGPSELVWRSGVTLATFVLAVVSTTSPDVVTHNGEVVTHNGEDVTHQPTTA